jgi:hypothetical protein
MTDDMTPAPTPPGQSAGWPRRTQLLIMIGSGAVLALTNCALAFFNAQSPVAQTCGAGILGLFLSRATVQQLLLVALVAFVAMILFLL